MRTVILIIFLTITSLTFCYSQRIEVRKSFGEYKYIQNEKQLTMDALSQIMESNKQSKELIKKARNKQITSMILGGVGGALIGWPIGTAIRGGDPIWALAGVGAGIIIIAIPIASSSSKNANKAVDIYNSNLDLSSSSSGSYLKLGINKSGIGISLNF